MKFLTSEKDEAKGLSFKVVLLMLHKSQEITYLTFIYTLKSLFVAAATIKIGKFLAQNLLSKSGYYIRAATNKDFTVYSHQDDSLNNF